MPSSAGALPIVSGPASDRPSPPWIATEPRIKQTTNRFQVLIEDYTLDPPTNRLTDGGPSVTAELLRSTAGPLFGGGSPGSAGFLFFGSLAVNSNMLSRANHGADDANKPANIIAHTPVAITMQKLVIFIAHSSCLTLLVQNTIRYHFTKIYHDHDLNSSPCRTLGLSLKFLDVKGTASHTWSQPKPLSFVYNHKL